jgi:hypothetical protein
MIRRNVYGGNFGEILKTEFIVKSDVELRPLYKKNYPRLLLRHPRQGSVPFCKTMRTTKNISN